ncbi:MAG TPA: NAD-dependent succinate-semialdehyde dehydrogenase [Phycisphaerae bacterium]|jgi:succinate-semialdehyde dehydrogenase/glutarate-semialdehyde dehydrogenase|nr:NAD-dependent succinate-semialdehyde dehydrogenase [Phycisphaerae bacterium]HOJ53504.1 NAD-dependent succinate-semialdehyde dehydrogenase [Phycisphaerae bacterium]HOL25339.1 NAD-dependent succinate-semialdehyde dehydrogenase [Phycisphaerae bacterium]HPP21843.1 NAD-dependent succinate-semialdehyde dehydrogenase [Phycisphaerae bacterium]HPU34878.1 NAD-dependent succinate-semialdehyde dehydrogenase [Phycisphaerae bacterium]
MLASAFLPQTCGFIAGRWVPDSAADRAPIINPATGELLAEVPVMGPAEAVAAVEAADRFLAAGTTLEQRRGWLTAMAEQILAARHELGRIITLEHGKPLKEGIGEVEYSAGFFQTCAESLDHLRPHALPQTVRGCRWTVHHRPAGVAGLITPWNFPLAMLAKKLSAAIGAGCGIVIKPASQTPLSAIAAVAIAERVGVPAGMVNLVIGPASPIGQVFCEHPAVRIISFTGSTEVGKKLMAAVAPHVKRLALELGGNAPFIVFEDADIEAAANHLIANKFRAGGQTCVCANRVYVHRRIHDAFVDAVAERVRKLKVGNGLEPDTDIGPLINRDAFDKVAAHVQDAVQRGARLIVGGQARRPEQDWGAFYPPTVLTGITPEMLVCREETFGPVIAVSCFDDEGDEETCLPHRRDAGAKREGGQDARPPIGEQEVCPPMGRGGRSAEEAVIEAANSTPYGLAAYVFTGDAARAERVAARLAFGHVGVNTGSGPTPEAPFGGMKQSGFGREGGVEGLLEFTEPQTVATAGNEN